MYFCQVPLDTSNTEHTFCSLNTRNNMKSCNKPKDCVLIDIVHTHAMDNSCCWPVLPNRVCFISHVAEVRLVGRRSFF